MICRCNPPGTFTCSSEPSLMYSSTSDLPGRGVSQKCGAGGAQQCSSVSGVGERAVRRQRMAM
eukprot:7380625-Prymnesium_polylepis.1